MKTKLNDESYRKRCFWTFIKIFQLFHLAQFLIFFEIDFKCCGDFIFIVNKFKQFDCANWERKAELIFQILLLKLLRFLYMIFRWRLVVNIFWFLLVFFLNKKIRSSQICDKYSFLITTLLISSDDNRMSFKSTFPKVWYRRLQRLLDVFRTPYDYKIEFYRNK